MTAAAKSRLLARLALVAIVAWAGFVRLWHCDSSLPGLQIDEASNAWNAYCLLKTGQDEWGQRWPIIATRAFDDYRSPLYLYLLMPFQAIGGMNVCTTRLPTALGGVATVLLIYWIGRRLFDVPTSLVAAALLALSPWHIQHTRWGHEGCITPLLIALALAAVLWASAKADWWRYALAGVACGLACYGYASVRVYIPITLVLAAVSMPGLVRRHWRPAAALGGGFIIAIAPLLVAHLMDPRMNQRAHEIVTWQNSDSIPSAAKMVVQRYAAHFGPDFLFRTGNSYVALSPPPGYGWLPWYMLPLMLGGMVVLVRQMRASPAARLMLVMLLCYPAADTIFGEAGILHPLRSFPGVLPMSLIGAVGAVWLARARPLGAILSAGMAIWIATSHALFAATFFGSFNDEPRKLWLRHVDLMQACHWLKPRLASVDAVFCTQEQLFLPHAATLVHLEYDPKQWFTDEKEYRPAPPPYDHKTACQRFGKIHFIFDREQTRRELAHLAANGKTDHVVMLLRADEQDLAAGHFPVGAFEIPGLFWLYFYEFDT